MERVSIGRTLHGDATVFTLAVDGDSNVRITVSASLAANPKSDLGIVYALACNVFPSYTTH